MSVKKGMELAQQHWRVWEKESCQGGKVGNLLNNIVESVGDRVMSGGESRELTEQHCGECGRQSHVRGGTYTTLGGGGGE